MVHVNGKMEGGGGGGTDKNILPIFLPTIVNTLQVFCFLFGFGFGSSIKPAFAAIFQ